MGCQHHTRPLISQHSLVPSPMGTTQPKPRKEDEDQKSTAQPRQKRREWKWKKSPCGGLPMVRCRLVQASAGLGCVNFDNILFLFRLQFFIMSVGPYMTTKKFQLDRYSPSHQEIDDQSARKRPQRSNKNLCSFSLNVWAGALNWSFRLTYYPQAV